MTSPEPLPVPEDDALDAAVSAVVDGVATPEETALVAAAPDGSARVEAMRSVADAVGSRPGVQDAGAAQRSMAAALAAFDTLPVLADGDRADGDRAKGGRTEGQPTPPSPITRLPAPPASSRSGRGPRLLGAAAALLVLLGLGAFSVAALRSNGPDTTATALNQMDRQVAGDAAAKAAAPDSGTGSLSGGAGPLPPAPGGNATALPETSAPEVARTAAAAPPVVDGGDIGRQEDVGVLTLRAAAALDGVPDAAVASPAAAAPSDVQACVAAGRTAVGDPLGHLRYRAAGTFGGVPAVFLAYDRTGAPPHVLLVVARSGCTLLASTPF